MTSVSRGRARFPGDVAAAFTEAVVLTGALSLYWLGLNLTKPSALSGASAWQVLTVCAYAVLLAVVTATVAAVLAVGVDRVSAALGGPPRAGSFLARAVLAATATLVFVDNMLYSAVRASLRNEDGSPAKLAFLLVSLCLGLLWAARSDAPSAARVRVTTIACASAALLASGVAAVYLNQEDEPSDLVRERDEAQLDVLILSSDGINADAMSVYSGRGGTTPFLDSIRDELMIYENAFTNNGNTTGSVVSLLTGRLPGETGVVYPPDALSQADARRSLPHLLGREGYYRANWAVNHYVDSRSQNLVDAFDVDNGHESSPVLRALPLGSGVPRWFVEDLWSSSLGLWSDALNVREMENPYGSVQLTAFKHEEDVSRLEGILKDIRTKSPYFINSHLLGSHGPYFALPDGSIREPQTDPWQELHYREAVKAFDVHVAEVFELLREEGKLDSTIVVITSDHGQQYDARQRVPLMIRFPGAAPAGRTSTNVQRADVAPTVLSLLGYRVPSFMDGRSLTEPGSVPDEREILAWTTQTKLPNLSSEAAEGSRVLTRIVCRHYTQTVGGVVVEEGRVPGSTAPCRARPSS